MRVAPITILASSDAASDQNSASQWLSQIFSYSVEAVLTGTPAGTLTLEGSVTGDINTVTGVVTNTNFVTIAGSSQVISDAGKVVWNVSGANYQFVRCVWTHTSGSAGTVAMYCFVRGF